MTNDELLKKFAETDYSVNDTLFPEWVIEDLYLEDDSFKYAVVHLKYPRLYGLVVSDEFKEIGGISLALTDEFSLANIHWLDMPNDIEDVSALMKSLTNAIEVFEDYEEEDD